jgi:hypothetical protein
MCNTLNNFFASVFTKERQDEELPEVETRFSHDSCCKLEYIDSTEKMVEIRIRKLKVGK